HEMFEHHGGVSYAGWNKSTGANCGNRQLGVSYASWSESTGANLWKSPTVDLYFHIPRKHYGGVSYADHTDNRDGRSLTYRKSQVQSHLLLFNMNQAKDSSELDLKAGIKKLDTLLEMVEELRASFMSVCDYLGELLNSGQFQDNAETLEREKRGEKSLTQSFDVDRFSRMNESCLNTMDKFLQLIGSCGDELEYARKISATWKDNSSIPVKKFLAMNINGKSGETIKNYKEDTQKNCQQATNIYTKESDIYFKRRKKDGIFGTIEIYDASAIDDWLAEAKQRPYPVGIEKVECDLSGRPSGLMVLVNNLLKAGIILKYNDINGSSVSFVRLTIIGYHEKVCFD
ncbi:16320_t:CDS:10, partial [Gigaspora rosea]